MTKREARNAVSQRKQALRQRIDRLREIISQNPEKFDQVASLRTQIRFLERDLITLDYRTPAQRAAGWK